MLFIYHLFQAAYHNAKPQLLKQQLQNIELEDGKVFIIFCGVLIASTVSLSDVAD